jgi:hypothetical protein
MGIMSVAQRQPQRVPQLEHQRDGTKKEPHDERRGTNDNKHVMWSVYGIERPFVLGIVLERLSSVYTGKSYGPGSHR